MIEAILLDKTGKFVKVVNIPKGHLYWLIVQPTDFNWLYLHAVYKGETIYTQMPKVVRYQLSQLHSQGKVAIYQEVS